MRDGPRVSELQEASEKGRKEASREGMVEVRCTATLGLHEGRTVPWSSWSRQRWEDNWWGTNHARSSLRVPCSCPNRAKMCYAPKINVSFLSLPWRCSSQTASVLAASVFASQITELKVVWEFWGLVTWEVMIADNKPLWEGNTWKSTV